MLWCYLRNPAFKTADKDYHFAADLESQANHLGVTIQADIIKQKLSENNGGYNALKFGKTDKRVYSDLTPGDHPIELARYQVANCYLGRSPLINSGGASGDNDFAEAARTAVINKRAGGMGLISGRKAFQRPMEEGIKLLNLVQGTFISTRASPSREFRLESSKIQTQTPALSYAHGPAFFIQCFFWLPTGIRFPRHAEIQH